MTLPEADAVIDPVADALTHAQAPLRCAGLVRIYVSPTGETHALRGVDAVFDRGRVAAVVGPSGSGKSSLLQVVALRERPTGGRLWVLGRPAERLRRAEAQRLRRTSVAWVPQRATAGLFPHLSAAEHVGQAAALRGVPVDPAEVLERVGLAERRRGRAGELSGGEQQRLTVAMATVGSPAVVVADEPTAELDDAAAALVLAELSRAAADGACVVMATHDSRAVRAADRVLLLRHGVLSTDQGRGRAAETVIDSAGRLQLSQQALALFPGGRAEVRIEEGGLRVLPVDQPADQPVARSS